MYYIDYRLCTPGKFECVLADIALFRVVALLERVGGVTYIIDLLR